MDRYNQILTHPGYIERVKKLRQLEKDRMFCRHDITHFLDVARIMYIISLENGNNIDKDIIYASALLHDTGRVEQYNESIPHHIASVSFARSVLPDCGYSQEEIEEICFAIYNHRNNAEGESKLSELLFSADKLSRLCFDCSAEKDCYWDDTLKNNYIRY